MAVADVLGRVRRVDDEVGEVAGLQRPYPFQAQAGRGVAGRGDDRLHRRQARFHHQGELAVLEVALEAGGGAGVGPHRNPHPGVVERLDVAHRGRELRLVGLRAAAVADALLPLRSLQRGDHLRIGVPQEERIVEPLRPLLVDVGRDLAHQGRADADAAVGQQVDQFLVDVEVADAVGDEVGAGLQQPLGVVEVVEVRGQLQAALVGRVDDRPVDFRRHLLGGAEVVVDPDLDEVDVHVGRRVHPLRRLLGGVGDDDRTGHAQPRVGQAGTLAVAHRDALGAVAAETGDGGHAVARVERELARHVLLCIEGRVGLQPANVVDVPVRVDQPRRHRPAGQIHRRGVLGRGDFAARPDRLDDAVPHHDRAALDGAAVPDDQARAGEGGQSRRRLDRLRRAAAGRRGGQDGGGRCDCRVTLQTLHVPCSCPSEWRSRQLSPPTSRSSSITAPSRSISAP